MQVPGLQITLLETSLNLVSRFHIESICIQVSNQLIMEGMIARLMNNILSI